MRIEKSKVLADMLCSGKMSEYEIATEKRTHRTPLEIGAVKS